MAFRLSALTALALLGAAPPAPPQAMIAASRARLQAGDFAGAAQIAEAAVARYPRNAGAVLLAGNFVRDRYGLAAALPWYDRVLALDPENKAALIDKAATLGDAGQTVAMLGVTRALLALDPKQPMAFYLQAVMAARAGQWDLARKLLYLARGRLDAVPGAMLLKGALDVQAGAYETAIAALTPLVASQPANRTARRLLGLALWRGGDLDGAVETLTPIAGEDTHAATVLARVHETRGERDRAAALFDAVPIRTAPTIGLPEAIAAANVRLSQANALGLIDALTRGGRQSEAQTVIDTYLAQNPRDAALLLRAGNEALAAGSWARATIALGRARMGSRDVMTNDSLAWALAKLGRRDEALALARADYALMPGSAPVSATYGALLVTTGRRGEGIALLEKAVAIAPDFAPFRAQLAAARRRP